VRQPGLTLTATGVTPWLDVSAGVWDPVLPGGGPVRQRWLDVDGALVATGGADRERWWMHWPSLGTYVFGSDGPVVAYPIAGSSHAALQDSFTRGVVPVVMLARGCEALHASAVLTGSGVVVFCARSGTGKSSLALALALQGAILWADDTVALPWAHDRIESVALPFPLRIDDTVREALGRRADVRFTDPGARHPLRRVYFLTRDATMDPGKPELTSVRDGSRFERLLAHAHPFELATDARRRVMIERLLRIAAAVPLYELRFAPSLEHLPLLAQSVSAHLSCRAEALPYVRSA
jgi:hypothetical protein